MTRITQITLMLVLLSTGVLVMHAQDRGIPHYCKTDVGVLGPYENDGSVKVGESCFGTRNGHRYEGVAVMGKNSDDSDESQGGRSQRSRGDRLPRYCKTDVGVLGPYENDGSVKVGDPCFGTRNGRRYEGVAVMGKDSDDENEQ